MSLLFRHHEKRPEVTTLDVDGPDELLNLDRHSIRHHALDRKGRGRFSSLPRRAFGEEELAKSNDSIPQKLWIDPYGVRSGNLWSDNYRNLQYQQGGQTCLAGRSSALVMEPLRVVKQDALQRERSRYIEPPGGRFVPALKPYCQRDKGPDPYDVGSSGLEWEIGETRRNWKGRIAESAVLCSSVRAPFETFCLTRGAAPSL